MLFSDYYINLKLWLATAIHNIKWVNLLIACLFNLSPKCANLDAQTSISIPFKPHHHIILFVRPLHFKPGMESYCWPNTDQLSWLSWWAYGIKISQVWPSCWLWGILIMFGCVLSQLKPSELYILSCGKGRGLRPWPFPQQRMYSSSGFILYITVIWSANKHDKWIRN